jgi:hypothetical protein
MLCPTWMYSRMTILPIFTGSRHYIVCLSFLCFIVLAFSRNILQHSYYALASYHKTFHKHTSSRLNHSKESLPLSLYYWEYINQKAVLSFISQWSVPPHHQHTHEDRNITTSPVPPNDSTPFLQRTPPLQSTESFPDAIQYLNHSSSPVRRQRSASRTGSRPASMVQTFQPPLMDVAQDTLPELQPIFTYLNSHSNKLYQEGYFLKLHDLDSRRLSLGPTCWY